MDYKEEMDPYLEEIGANLDNFIENINCLRETFGYSEIMLRQQNRSALKDLSEFTNAYTSQDEKGETIINIPNEKNREYKKLLKKKIRAEKASKLIPPSYIISLISIFDSFLAGLVRCVYNLKQDLLLESKQAFTYREIANFVSPKEVKKVIIDSTIDKLFRDSHKEQIEWFEKALEVPLKKFSKWGDFMELTERRNLFVHADGIVSMQYIGECTKNNYNLQNIEIGSKLSADNAYFEKSFALLYEMGIMLTQILINKLYIDKVSNGNELRDKVFINNVYDLICEKHYEIAINVSNFVRDKSLKRNNKDKTFIELNLAQAYKWSGNEKACKSILKELDTSAMNTDLQIPKKVLEEKFDEVFSMMKNLGRNSQILTKEAYREWPIFEKIREKKEFEETFELIFGEKLFIPNSSDINKIETEDIQEEALVKVTS